VSLGVQNGRLSNRSGIEPPPRQKPSSVRRDAVPKRGTTRQTVRVLQLAKILQTKERLTAQKLAQLAGASRRTIFRDLSLLSDGGICVSFDRAARAYKPDNEPLSFASFTNEEIDILVLAVEAVAQGFLGLDRDTARSARDKILATLPETMQRRWQAVDEKIHFQSETKSVVKIAPILHAIQFCLVHRKNIELTFNDDAPRAIRTCTPTGLRFVDGSWNLVAESCGTNVTCIIPLNTIADATPSREVLKKVLEPQRFDTQHSIVELVRPHFK